MTWQGFSMPPLNEQQTTELDPRYYYAVGRDLEASRDWERALLHYQKAMSCMPHLLGAAKWFASYLLDGRRHIDISPEQTAEIYTAMGRCYEAMEHRDNALLCYKAATTWYKRCHPRSAARSDTASTMKPFTAKQNITNGDQLDVNRRMEDIAQQLTIVLTTSHVDKLKKYKELSPPTSRLVSATYQTMLETFGAPLLRCSKILCYDYPEKAGENSKAYEKSLDLFSRRYGFDMVTYPQLGLHAILRRLVPEIKTPYLALIEHDWFFRGPGISIHGLLNIFKKHQDVHHIRFNKRINHIANWDYIMEREEQTNDIQLLRTTAYSNNPCIIRKEKLLNEWLPMCSSDPEFTSINQSGSAMGLEEPLFKRYMKDVRRLGFSKAHKRWGTYIVGEIGESPRIIHLGE
jgi:tetratricopeptide (TPR) repeat protein